MNTYLCIDLNNNTIVSFCILDRKKNILYCGDKIIGDSTLPHDGSLKNTSTKLSTDTLSIPISDTEQINNLLKINFNTVKNQDYKKILSQLNLEEYII